MAKTYQLEVYSPSRRFFTGPVEALVLTLADGQAAVYADHAPFTAPVMAGELRIKETTGWHSAFIAEGIIEVTHHKTVILAGAAEWPGEIDTARAETAKHRAEELIQNAEFVFARSAAQTALLRAEHRLRLAPKDGT